MYGVADVYALTCEIYGVEPMGHSWGYEGSYGGHGNSLSKVEVKYEFNPRPAYIKSVVLRWLPAFFLIVRIAISEACLNVD